jgi:hypothetical protein
MTPFLGTCRKKEINGANATVPRAGSFFTEDVLKIAGQQRGYAVRHIHLILVGALRVLLSSGDELAAAVTRHPD